MYFEAMFGLKINLEKIQVGTIDEVDNVDE